MDYVAKLYIPSKIKICLYSGKSNDFKVPQPFWTKKAHFKGQNRQFSHFYENNFFSEVKKKDRNYS